MPIVYVPVHIVMGMPMTVGIGMRETITMGTKNHIIGIAHGYSHGHAHYDSFHGHNNYKWVDG